MISIMKYMDKASNSSVVDELMDMHQRLVKAIGRCAIRVDHASGIRFHAEIRRIWNTLTEATTLSDLRAASESAEKAMEEYNWATLELIDARHQELQQMVGVLTGAVEELANGNDRSVTKLRAIERQIEQASAIEDIRILRAKLTECVDQLRREVTRQHEESGRVVAEVRGTPKGNCQQTGVDNTKFEAHDPVTGLSGRLAAQQTIQNAISGKAEFCVAAFVIHRIDLIGRRFGQAVSDGVMRSFSAHLRKDLSMARQSFRWNSSTILVFVEGTPATPRIKGEIRQFASTYGNEIVDTGHHTVLLPLGMVWTIIEGSTKLSTDELVEKIEKACKDSIA